MEALVFVVIIVIVLLMMISATRRVPRCPSCYKPIRNRGPFCAFCGYHFYMRRR